MRYDWLKTSLIFKQIGFSLFLVLLFFHTGLAGELIIPDEKALDAPLYPGMRFKDYAGEKTKGPVARYCSNDSYSIVRKYYKDLFKKAPLMDQGGKTGTHTRIMLDVASPDKWRYSVKYIEIADAHDNSGCNTLVGITSSTQKSSSSSPIPSSNNASSTRRYVGIGGYINTINFSGGPTVVIWPFANIGMQLNYGVGTFTSYEARVLYKFKSWESLNPFFGAGYICAEKKVSVLNSRSTISNGSGELIIGVETNISKSVSLYTDITGAPLKLKKDIVNGTQSVNASISYSPVTFGVGVVYYLF